MFNKLSGTGPAAGYDPTDPRDPRHPFHEAFGTAPQPRPAPPPDLRPLAVRLRAPDLMEAYDRQFQAELAAYQGKVATQNANTGAIAGAVGSLAQALLADRPQQPPPGAMAGGAPPTGTQPASSGQGWFSGFGNWLGGLFGRGGGAP